MLQFCYVGALILFCLTGEEHLLESGFFPALRMTIIIIIISPNSVSMTQFLSGWLGRPSSMNLRLLQQFSNNGL